MYVDDISVSIFIQFHEPASLTRKYRTISSIPKHPPQMNIFFLKIILIIVRTNISFYFSFFLSFPEGARYFITCIRLRVCRTSIHVLRVDETFFRLIKFQFLNSSRRTHFGMFHKGWYRIFIHNLMLAHRYLSQTNQCELA